MNRAPAETRVTAAQTDHIGIDQWGNVYRRLGRQPRKTLMALLGAKRAQKMYMDRQKGPPIHIGYIIAKHWVTLYQRVDWPA